MNQEHDNTKVLDYAKALFADDTQADGPVEFTKLPARMITGYNLVDGYYALKETFISVRTLPGATQAEAVLAREVADHKTDHALADYSKRLTDGVLKKIKEQGEVLNRDSVANLVNQVVAFYLAALDSLSTNKGIPELGPIDSDTAYEVTLFTELVLVKDDESGWNIRATVRYGRGPEDDISPETWKYHYAVVEFF